MSELSVSSAARVRRPGVRLFAESLKRIRVPGLAMAILTLSTAVILPLAMWIAKADFDTVRESSFHTVAAALYIPMVLLPFLLAFSFSFLQKRRGSDFFHAIPYKRRSVYLHFTAAPVALTLAVQLVAAVISGLLFAVCPYVNYDVFGFVRLVPVIMLATLLLGGVMMPAVTLTGTAGSCTLLFFLLLTAPRIVGALFGGVLSGLHFLTEEAIFNRYFTAPAWNLPLNLFLDAVDAAEPGSLFRPEILIYTAAVTVALYLLGGVFYGRRSSEMAGNAAPSVRVQAIFRCLFTLPPALLFTAAALHTDTEAWVLLVLAVGTLLVYFLYELCTTKRARNMLTSIPWLGAVAALCFLFVGGIFGVRHVIETKPLPEAQVEAVTVTVDNYRPSYYAALANETPIRDREVIGLLTDTYKQNQARVRGASLPVRFNESESGAERAPYLLKVTFHQTDGRTVSRELHLTEKDQKRFSELARRAPEISEILHRLPPDDLHYGAIDSPFGDMWESRPRHLDGFYAVFAEEFRTLTDEQKEMVTASNLVAVDLSQGLFRVSVSGMMGTGDGQSLFHADTSFIIHDFMPRTVQYLMETVVKPYVEQFHTQSFYENPPAAVKEFLEQKSGTKPASLNLSVMPAAGGQLITARGSISDGDLRRLTEELETFRLSRSPAYTREALRGTLMISVEARLSGGVYYTDFYTITPEELTALLEKFPGLKIVKETEGTGDVVDTEMDQGSVN